MTRSALRATVSRVSWILFASDASPGRVERLESGALRVRGRVSRTGIQEYAPWPGAPVQDRKIKVYRPHKEVFSDRSLSTLKGIPVTIGHPPEKRVTRDSWKRYSVGHVEDSGQEVLGEDGEHYVETSILVSDGRAAQALEGRELAEISQGYMTEIVWQGGTTDKGEAYDAIQTEIVHNHTALLGVGQARAGGGARVLLDSNQEGKKMDQKVFAEYLRQKLADSKIPEAQREAVSKQVSDSLIDLVDGMDKDLAEKMIDRSIETSAKLVAADAKPESKPAEPKAPEAKPEQKPIADKSDEERGRALADSLLQTEQNVVALIDAREEVRGMLPPDYSFQGKSVRQLHLDAIEACAPKVFAQISATDSDDFVKGLFASLKANKVQWKPAPGATNDNKSDLQAGFREYEKRCEQAFADSWSN